LGVEVIDSSYTEIDFDVHIPLMGVPYALGLNSEGQIPLAEGFLKPDPVKVQQYKQKYFFNGETSLINDLVTPHPNPPQSASPTPSLVRLVPRQQDDLPQGGREKSKIGIKWQGNAAYDRNRIIPIEAFYNLFDLPNTQFYSIQKDDGSEELKNLPSKYNVIDLGSTFNDFTDTAAAIENFDLVICNDTSLAHLAGALGKPCYILLPYVSNWRWHDDFSYSPWYKSVKLFKQTTPDNWSDVFEKVFDVIARG
jgi:ADP-heptose:LPS heptosyltransferase